MSFFVRYFVELPLPTAVAEQALDKLPPDWLLAVARLAHARALGLLLESDAGLGGDQASTLELSMESPTRSGSTTIRLMAWTLIRPGSATPFLQADLEIGSLGRGRTQLALSGRYFSPGENGHQRLDRGIAQRVGEATIKMFVDGLANTVERAALEFSVRRSVA
jgi:hypothetical protein